MKKVSDKLSIAPQVIADDISHAAANGFAAIINNRPDNEEAGQPSAGENRMVAEREGLCYSHIPVVPGQVKEWQVRAFQKALAEARGPVLAHCKTGARSTTLYVIGEVLDGRMSKEEVALLGQRLGFDLSGVVKWLDAHGHQSVQQP
ncbi:TIGR01244 family sulfur transferase [Mesorhizobium sp. LHD-90]|uniref:TIGR01244 family sulfur transferase n=1 Tax=Mesorhizobium sp. LHD-90 TaxID=3071414 RepID=UPI0027E01906|nr:TIGR01244 family sulfur transferase [Mesorhizobium sp. LHD-90]MDQ6434607.1 TIGR01244 family sulfur transferase [Mesorhizobium sp. LHD-90]